MRPSRRLAPLLAVLVLPLSAAPADAASRSWSDCGKAATTEAAAQAGLPARMDADPKLRAVFGEQPPSQTYTRATRAFCADFDGDGDVDRLGLYECCTVSSPAPFAILRNDGGRFAIAYARLSDVVFRMSPGRGRAIVVKTPRYAATDPNCCPSRLTERRITWTGSRFKSTTRTTKRR
jgi:hypothetical protein